MTDILHDFPVAAPRPKVFEAVSTPDGLDKWWTRTSKGLPQLGALWEFYFDEGFDWRAQVIRFDTDRLIEWEITTADADWSATRVAIELADHPGGLTWIRFSH